MPSRTNRTNQFDSGYVQKKWNNRHSRQLPGGKLWRQGAYYGSHNYGGYNTPPRERGKRRFSRKRVLTKLKMKAIRKDYNYQMRHQLYDTWCDEFIRYEPELCEDRQNDFCCEYQYIPVWNCLMCKYQNIERLLFCCNCNHPFIPTNKEKQDENDNLLSEYIEKALCLKNTYTHKYQKCKSPNKKTTKTDNNLALENDEYCVTEVEQYKKQRYTQFKNTKLKRMFLKSFDIEITLILSKYNQYEYIENKLWLNKNEGTCLMNVPMRLINLTLKYCLIKLTHHSNKQKIHILRFEPETNKNILIPIYVTQYSSVYQNQFIPTILQNNELSNIIRHCLLSSCIQNDKFQYVSIQSSQFNYDSLHYPLNNRLPLSMHLQTLLWYYIPSMDILNSVLFPFIGYTDNASYIKMNGENVQLNIDQVISNKIHKIDENYGSSEHIPSCYKRRVKKIKKIKKSIVDEVVIPEFFRTLNDHIDSDESHEIQSSEKSKRERHLFVQPYKYRRGAKDLLDNDPDRDRKWWEHLRYNRDQKISFKTLFKINEKVRVKRNGKWHSGTIKNVTSCYIDVRYGKYEICWVANLANIHCERKQIQSKWQRKRNAHSKSNNTYHFKSSNKLKVSL